MRNCRRPPELKQKWYMKSWARAGLCPLEAFQVTLNEHTELVILDEEFVRECVICAI